MDISYLGHSSFKLRGKSGVVVTDPFGKRVGFPFPSVSADVVTVSHHHPDHDAIEGVGGTTRRQKPFIIDQPGEYEVLGISVFAYPTFHDESNGTIRGPNTIMAIHVDGVKIVHLGDLGHQLSQAQLSAIGVVDVLLVPVGGEFTIDAKKANELVEEMEPMIVIPMHFRTPKHAEQFSKLSGVDDFLRELGMTDVIAKEKLSVTSTSLPSEMEVVVLKA